MIMEQRPTASFEAIFRAVMQKLCAICECFSKGIKNNEGYNVKNNGEDGNA